jgi:hypothetical protein
VQVCRDIGTSIDQQHRLFEPNQQAVFCEEAVVVGSTSTTSPITEVSSMTAAELGITGKVIIRQVRDSNNNEHFLVKYEMTTTDLSGRKCAKARACKVCQAKGIGWNDTIYYCIACGIKSSCCNDPSHSCFKEHVTGIKRNTRFTGLGLQVV